MKLHTRILTVLADDISAFNAEDITIVLSPHFGMCSEDLNELKTIMAERHPTIRLEGNREKGFPFPKTLQFKYLHKMAEQVITAP